MVKTVAQRTKLFTMIIIISVGQNEFEVNRLHGVLRAKSPIFIRKCDTQSYSAELLKMPPFIQIIPAIASFYHELYDRMMTALNDARKKRLRDRKRSLMNGVNLRYLFVSDLFKFTGKIAIKIPITRSLSGVISTHGKPINTAVRSLRRYLSASEHQSSPAGMQIPPQ